MSNETDDIHSINDDIKSPSSRLSSASKKKQIDEINKLTNENHEEETTNNHHNEQIITSTDFSNYLIILCKKK
jgi:hypothetical protein